MQNIFKKLFGNKEKNESNIKTSKPIFQRVIRVLDYESLKKFEHCNFSFWNYSFWNSYE